MALNYTLEKNAYSCNKEKVSFNAPWNPKWQNHVAMNVKVFNDPITILRKNHNSYKIH
jgi:hypothetical protein